MEELRTEIRATNRLLRLAFAEAISQRLRTLIADKGPRTVLSLLADGEQHQSDKIQEEAKRAGVGRTSLFGLLNQLESAGVIDRPRRGVVQLTAEALSFLPPLSLSKTDGAAPADAKEASRDGQSEEADA